MRLDWTIPITTLVILAIQMVVGTWVAARALRAIERGIDDRFNAFGMLLNTFKEGDLRELKTSVTRLECGQDEWTKALRERTHDLANYVNALTLRVDRLERPDRHDRRDDTK